ncbi:MAG TPA: hypothetical protein VGA50_19200 [Kiloniellales bacterium]
MKAGIHAPGDGANGALLVAGAAEASRPEPRAAEGRRRAAEADLDPLSLTSGLKDRLGAHDGSGRIAPPRRWRAEPGHPVI